MKFNYLTLLLIIVGFSGNRSLAQVTANFSANKTSGCTPLSDVQFTDKSLPSDNLSWSWDLGNGETSSLQNPITTYSLSGNYTVKLTATRNGLSTSKTMIIRVFKNPVANFSNTDNVTKACVPLTVRFEDHSTLGDTTMRGWLWQYGTGAYDTIRQPSFTYYFQKMYDVSLTITDNHGCWNTAVKTNYIDVAKPPQVSFYADPSYTCMAPATIKFMNNSTVKGTPSYQWISGSSVSIIKDASFTFTKYDTAYTVKLTVTDLDYNTIGNCVSNNQLDYKIEHIKAIGTVKQGNKTINNTGDIVCAGKVDLASHSLPKNGLCLWIVDNNVFSTYDSIAQYTFNQPGNHTISLISTPGSYCADTLKWTFYVEKVVPQFTQTPAKTCQPSALVSFNNTSSVNAASFVWKFSGGTTSTIKDPPSITYSVPNDNNSYEVHDAVLFPTKLFAYTINGCMDSVENSFIIRRPTAMFSVDTISGCAPLLVNFTDKSISDTSIMFHDWDFGTGPVTHKTTETTITYTYASAGTYNARFWITNKSNCVDTSYVIPIKVGTLPGANFSVAPTTVCQSDVVTITDQTPVGDKADFWLYTINGVSISSCSNDKSPTFRSKPDVGTLTVKQVVGYNGCNAETTKTITNNGPIAAFTYNIPDCTNPYDYAFTGTYKVTGGTTTFKWDFGDGTSTQQSPAHTYVNTPADKDYTVKFIVFNGGCSDTAIQVVRVRQRVASFNAPAWACALQPVSFSASASQPFSVLCQDKYIWNFNDTTAIIRTDVDPVKHTFKYSGNYKVLFSTIHDNGCLDTVSHRIRIYRPRAGLKTDKVGGCPGTQIKFTDMSQPDLLPNPNPISSLYMNFGDMTSENSTTPGSSFNHIYIDQSIYTPYIKATDTKGCVDSTIVSIGIEQPLVTLIPSVIPPQTCVNTTITFTQTALEVDSMRWNFGDGTISKSKVLSIDHAYATEGDFRAKIRVFKFGCSDSTELLVQTQKADASFTLSDTVLYCLNPPKPIQFKHLYPSHTIVSGEWDTGDNKYPYDTTNNIIMNNYKTPGIYTAQLSLTTSYGCTDYKTKTIKVMSPGAKFSIDPSVKKACKKDLITFTMYDTVNIWKYSWTFGDGTGDSTSRLKVPHRYTAGGTQYVHLNLKNPSGCEDVVTDTITIDDVVAKFSVPDTAGCDKTPMFFTNLSTGNTTQTWDFGDGTLLPDVSPEHTYASSPNPYPVTLVVYSPNLCTDTARRSMTVTTTPSLKLSISSCANKKAQLHAETTTGNYIIWWPSQGISPINSYDPVYYDTTSTHVVGPVYYKAKVTNIKGGCFITDSVLIIRPKATISPTSASIAIGDSVQINVTDTVSIKSYKWEPATFLSCSDCLNPVASPEESTLYYLVLSEPSGCFSDSLKVAIFLDYTHLGLNFPDAFKPGSDVNNNIFNMKGKGILEVLEFKIYNRWGNLVFSSTDKNRGWDGTYQGKEQPIDTYVYVATVRMGDVNVKGGVIVKRKGTFLLLR